MNPILVNPKPDTIEADLEFLSLQVAVGAALLANPAITRYLELQVEMLTCQLMDFNKDPNSDAVKFKDAILLRTQQVAVYKHLHDLASKHSEIQAAHTAKRIQYQGA